MNYQTWKFSPNFSIEIDNFPGNVALSDVEEAIIDQLWNEAQNQNPSLFNGKMLSFVSFIDGKLKGCFVDYKYYWAQLKSPKLKSVLKIKPIAISCSCTCQNKILLGKRSREVTGSPGCYELIPSGGISIDCLQQGKIDLRKQALIELEEEAFISEKNVESCTPIALIKDIHTDLFEIYIEIKLYEKNGLEKLPSYSNNEYSIIQWIQVPELLDLIKKEKENFVPFSLFLVNMMLRYKV